jgi:hypothetical protein
VLDEQAMVFRDATPQTWSVARADRTAADYTYDVEYVGTDGVVTPLVGRSGRITGSGDLLVLPMPPAVTPVTPVTPVEPAAPVTPPPPVTPPVPVTPVIPPGPVPVPGPGTVTPPVPAPPVPTPGPVG